MKKDGRREEEETRWNEKVTVGGKMKESKRGEEARKA